MDVSIPTALKALASGGQAMKAISRWLSQSKGDSRALVGELKNNLLYLDMVAKDAVPLVKVIDKLSVQEYQRLAKQGFNFNKMKASKITAYPSLKGSDLAPWAGKSTEALVIAIYEKINDLQLRYPYVADKPNYRWQVRVTNIRKRIWLLLRHVAD